MTFSRKLAAQGFRVRIAMLVLTASLLHAQPRRKVIIDQDCSGPGGSNLQTLLVMLQSPQVEVLGITVVSGDQWRDEEIAHTLRLLEIIGRTDVPVIPGAVFPLVNRREEHSCGRSAMGRLRTLGPGTIVAGTRRPLFLSCRRVCRRAKRPLRMPLIS